MHSFCTSLENLSTNSNLVYLSTRIIIKNPSAEFVNLRSHLINLISKLIIYDSYSSLDDNFLQNIQKLMDIYKNIEYQNYYYNSLILLEEKN